MENELLMFQQQISEDIGLIQNDLLYMDPHLNKKEYAFNYWVLRSCIHKRERQW